MGRFRGGYRKAVGLWSTVHDSQKLAADGLAILRQVNCGERNSMALDDGRFVVIDTQGRIEQDARGVAGHGVVGQFLGAQVGV